MENQNGAFEERIQQAADYEPATDVSEPPAELKDLVQVEAEEEIAKPVGLNLRPGTLMAQLDEKDKIFMIQVLDGFCVVTQSVEGEKVCYFGGSTHELQRDDPVKYLFVYPDSTAAIDREAGFIVAIVSCSREDPSASSNAIACFVFTASESQMLVLPVKHYRD